MGPDIVDIVHNTTSDGPAKWKVRWVLGQNHDTDAKQRPHDYIDHKFGIAGTRADGWLHFKLDNVETGQAWFCDAACEWGHYSHPRQSMFHNTEWALEGTEYVPGRVFEDSKWISADKERCIYVKEAGAPSKREPHTMHVSVRVKANAPADSLVYISRVVWI